MAAPTVGTSVSTTASGSSITINTLAISGSDKLLMVMAGGGAAALGDRSTSNITVAGSSITKLGEGDDGGWVNCEVWYQKNPADATPSIVATFGGGSSQICMGATLLTGVDQTSTFGSVAQNGAGNTSNSLSVSSAGTDAVVYAATSTDDESGITGTGTERWKQTGVGSDTTFGAQTYPGNASGVTAAWTQDVSGWASVAVSINGVGGGAAAARVFVRRMTMLGVG